MASLCMPQLVGPGWLQVSAAVGMYALTSLLCLLLDAFLTQSASVTGPWAHLPATDSGCCVTSWFDQNSRMLQISASPQPRVACGGSAGRGDAEEGETFKGYWPSQDTGDLDANALELLPPGSSAVTLSATGSMGQGCLLGSYTYWTPLLGCLPGQGVRLLLCHDAQAPRMAVPNISRVEAKKPLAVGGHPLPQAWLISGTWFALFAFVPLSSPASSSQLA